MVYNLDLFKKIYTLIYQGKHISSGAVELNLLCNERCIFCSRDAHILSEKEYLKTSEFKSFIEDKEVAVFCGGEPLLDPRLPDLLAYCKQKGKFTSVITNGTAFKDQSLCEKILCNLDFLTLSIPSLNEKTFSYLTGSSQYSSLMEAFKNLSEYPKQVIKSANVLLLKSSLPTLMESYQKLKEANLKDLYLFSFLYPIYLGRLTSCPEEYLSYEEITPYLDPVLKEIKKDQKLIRLENCASCITTLPADSIDFIDSEEPWGKKAFYTKKIENELIFYNRDDIIKTYDFIEKCNTCNRRILCKGIVNPSKL